MFMKDSAFTTNYLQQSNSIIRDSATKAASLMVSSAVAWELFSGDTRENMDCSSPVLSGSGAGTFPLPGDTPGDRSHALFAFVSSGKTVYLAERQLPMEGGYNFRDIGGFPGHGGKQVSWGRLFRADDLHSLTMGDLEYLASIPLVTVVDFRGEREMERVPDKLPVSARRYVPMSILPGSITPEHIHVSPEEGEKVMMESYRLFVKDPAITARFRDFFRHVQDGESGPLLYHCAAGKDRTGFATAMILYALGVHEELIMQDYLSSSRYLSGKYPSAKGIFSVQEKFLNSALEQIRESYGSVGSYLRVALDIDKERMRSLYLS